MIRIIVGAMVLCALAGQAAADAKQAKKLNTKGMKLYKKKNYADAQEVFVQAVAADPDMVIPHYNLASTAAINYDLDIVVEQLTWLKASTDPQAAKRIAKAKTDKDFQRVAGYPQVRELLGMPALDTLGADLLLEYGGLWSGIDEGMMDAWDEVTFAKNGTFKERSHTGEDGVTRKAKGKWSIADGKVVLTYKSAQRVFAWGACGTVSGANENDGQFCLLGQDEAVELSHGGQ